MSPYPELSIIPGKSVTLLALVKLAVDVSKFPPGIRIVAGDQSDQCFVQRFQTSTSSYELKLAPNEIVLGYHHFLNMITTDGA